MVGAFLPNEVIARGGDAWYLGPIMLAPLVMILVACFHAHVLCKAHGAQVVLRRGLLLGTALPFANALIGDQLRGESFCMFFVASRALDGVAQALVEVAGLALLLRRSDDGRRVALSLGLTEGVRAVASVVGPILGGVAYSQGAGRATHTRAPAWYAAPGLRTPFLLAGLLSVGVVLLTSAACAPPAPCGDAPATTPAACAAARPRARAHVPWLWLMAGLHALAYAPLGLLEAAVAPFLLAPPFRASLAWVGGHMTLGSLGLAVAALCTSALAAQCGAGQRGQLVAGQAMQALGLLVLAICTRTSDAGLAYTLTCCGVSSMVVSAA